MTDEREICDDCRAEISNKLSRQMWEGMVEGELDFAEMMTALEHVVAHVLAYEYEESDYDDAMSMFKDHAIESAKDIARFSNESTH